MARSILRPGVFGRRPRVRSIPRAGAAAVLVVMLAGGGTAAAVRQVRSAPSLPSIPAQRLIAASVSALARPRPVSGEVTARLDLGLPSLPQVGPQPDGLAGLLSGLAGEQRIRVWASADGLRVEQLLPQAERALYVNRQGAWAWDSDGYTATHLAEFPEPFESVPPSIGSQAEGSQLLQLADPMTLARMALDAVSPTTIVAVASSVRMAGRACYVLSLTPRQAGTLIGRVEVAIDAATHLPLSVSVFAKGARAASVSVAFGSVSFGAIDPSVYEFTPPPGATVMQPSQHGLAGGIRPGETGGRAALASSVRVFGAGWATAVAIRLPSAQSNADLGDGVTLQSLLPFSGPLFSARLAARPGHAWLLFGAVPQSALAAAESSLS